MSPLAASESANSVAVMSASDSKRISGESGKPWRCTAGLTGGFDGSVDGLGSLRGNMRSSTALIT